MTIAKITLYSVEVLSQTSKTSAFVKLYDSNERQIGSISFWRPKFIEAAIADELASPADDNLIFASEQLSEVLDILRNEQPVYFVSTRGVGKIIAGREPVGEAE